MGYRVRLPFHVFQLEFSPGTTFVTPLNDTINMRLGQSAQQLAREYQKAFQKALFKQGNLSILEEHLPAELTLKTLTVDIPAARDGISYPGFTIDFDYYQQQWASGYWGSVPTLGVEAFAKTEEKLVKRLLETIRIDFARNQRLKNVKNLLEVTWYPATRHQVEEIGLEVPDPGEAEEKQAEKEKLLPQLARKLELTDPVAYGREEELKQMKNILTSSFTRNLLVVGNGGVGKTALIYEAVQRLPKWKLAVEVWETTASAMIKALMGEHSWEFNVGELVKELKNKPVILYLGNLMDLFEVGQYEGNDVSIGEFLHPFLTRGELQVIAECTEREYSAITLKTPSYLNSFQQLRLEEPGEQQLFSIIEQKMSKLADRYQVDLEESGIHEAIRLSRRFTPYSGMPGRPIRFLESILLRKSVSSQQVLDRLEVIRAFSLESGMPAFMTDPSVPMSPEAIKTSFNEQVFSQEEAVSAVVDAMAAVKTALARTGKPIASFLFVGPTGVGKTELAKVLAQFMFGHRSRMVRFDMSEFSSPAAVLRLTGLTEGEDGLLTSALRREPFCVLLFDELEKADDSFYDLLLQILSEGRLTDSRGRLANFCSSLIIMTSNIGAQRFTNQPVQLSGTNQPTQEQGFYQKAVQEHFRPELYNRIDRIIPFQSLDMDSVRFVIDREMALLRQREGLKYRNVALDIDDAVLDHLGKVGYNATYGARYLQRTVRDQLVLPLAEVLNQHEFEDQLQVQLLLKNGSISITAKSDPLAFELLFEELRKQQNADYASRLRRLISSFRNGYYTTIVNQDIERLEEHQKKESKQFWANKHQVERYMTLTELRDRTEVLQEGIHQLEQQLSLMVLGQIAYRPDLEQELSAWESSFYQLKLDLFLTVHPEQNRCFFQVYGDDPDIAMAQYLKLFDKKDFTYTLQALYYNHAHYHRYQREPTRRSAEQKGLTPYTRRAISHRNPDFSPAHKGDTLVGIDCTIFGPGVLAYLSPEAGAQSWQLVPNARESKIKVQVNKSYQQPPDDIKRSDFVRRPEVRRTVTPGFIKDTSYQWNRECNLNNIPDFMEEELDQAFRSHIELTVQ